MGSASRPKPAKTAAGRLATLRRAENLLYSLIDGDSGERHPAYCDCVLCDAWHAAFRARMNLTRPGYRALPPRDEAAHA